MKQTIVLFSFIQALALAAPGDIYLAKIKSIQPGTPVSGNLPVTVTYEYHCSETLLRTFKVRALPITKANPRIGVGVVLQEHDSGCDSTAVLDGKVVLDFTNIVGGYRFSPVLP